MLAKAPAFKEGEYRHDGRRLVCVVQMSEEGNVVVEDCRTNRRETMHPSELAAWRLVIPMSDEVRNGS